MSATQDATIRDEGRPRSTVSRARLGGRDEVASRVAVVVVVDVCATRNGVSKTTRRL
jgi:hypothetical protein